MSSPRCRFEGSMVPSTTFLVMRQTNANHVYALHLYFRLVIPPFPYTLQTSLLWTNQLPYLQGAAFSLHRVFLL